LRGCLRRQPAASARLGGAPAPQPPRHALTHPTTPPSPPARSPPAAVPPSNRPPAADKLLERKRNRDLLQPYAEREAAAVGYVRAVNPALVVVPGPLADPQVGTPAALRCGRGVVVRLWGGMYGCGCVAVAVAERGERRGRGRGRACSWLAGWCPKGSLSNRPPQLTPHPLGAPRLRDRRFVRCHRCV
jgi:hypothetical protein